MPKLGIPESPLTKVFAQVQFPSRESVTSVLNQQNINFLGSGKYCIVTKGPTPETVDAINYVRFSRLFGLRLLYSQQILHLMFPENFPAFYAVYWENTNGEEKHKFTGSSRQFVTGKQLQSHPEVEDLLTPTEDQIEELSQGHPPKQIPLWLVEDTLKLIDGGLWFDRNPNNFFITSSGQQVYIDTLHLNRQPIHRPHLFTNIMDKYNRGEAAKQKVLTKLSRLQQLYPI